jgi:hypothetical protein
MKIAIIAGLANFNPIYSISTIIRTQCKYFIENGHEVDLLTNINFNKTNIPENINKIKIKNILPVINNDKTWENNQELIESTEIYERLLMENCNGYAIVISHDLVILPMYLPVNLALRKLESKIKSKWYHWIHSKPAIEYFPESTHDLFNKFTFTTSIFCYPNNSDKEEVCKFLNITEKNFRCIYNSLDLDIYFNQSFKIRQIMSKYTKDHDFLIVYPSRLNSSKRIDKIIELTFYLKSQKLNPLIIICNTYNNDKIAKTLLKYYLLLVDKYKIQDNLIFTSELGFENGLNNDEIKNLFTYSSFFIFPTITETCPLVLLEAAINSNVLILNKNLKALEEIASENAFYLNFDDHQEKWLADCHDIIKKEIQHNKILKAKNQIIKKFTTKIIYDNFI